MTANLDQYFERIAYGGPCEPTLDVLGDVHERHIFTFPYENLDVILENPVDQNIERIFDKMVLKGRGGWCYEQNGLLGWALSEIGFEVTRMTGGVMRALIGDEAWGNHLVLRVDLDGPWIADAGLGDAILRPARLREGEFSQDWRCFRFEDLGDGVWRFRNRKDASPLSFDVINKSADEDLFEATGSNLQEDAQSMFRQNLICQLMTKEGTHMLIGRVLSDTGPGGGRSFVQSADELEHTLRSMFKIATPDLTGLWDRVVARHTELFGETPLDEISFGTRPD